MSQIDRWYKKHLITRNNGWWHAFCESASSGRIMADTLEGAKEMVRDLKCKGCGHSL
jgi:hypothetical protein